MQIATFFMPEAHNDVPDTSDDERRNIPLLGADAAPLTLVTTRMRVRHPATGSS